MCCGVQEAQATGQRRRGAVADIHMPEVSVLKQVSMPQTLPSWGPLILDRLMSDYIDQLTQDSLLDTAACAGARVFALV